MATLTLIPIQVGGGPKIPSDLLIQQKGSHNSQEAVIGMVSYSEMVHMRIIHGKRCVGQSPGGF
jgi:hypothetical protein